MLRLFLTLLALVLLAPSVRAIQLGDSRKEIVMQYGTPPAGQAGQSVATYRWTGWRLDIEYSQDAAQRLVFTKDAGFLSEAEEWQLLNDNGGSAFWLPVERLSFGAAAVSKWRRTTDGAEAFTSPARRTMTLVTKSWADAQAKNDFYDLQQHPSKAPTTSKMVVTAPAIQIPQDPLAPFMATLSRLTMTLVGFIFLATIVVALVRQASGINSHEAGGLRTPRSVPPQLRSACTLPPTLPFSADEPSASAKPKSLADLSWQEFELLIGELYRREGYAVEMCSVDGSDGGVDLWLHKDRQTTLVQCKHWKVYQVGVTTVRELFGILTAEKADRAILVTTGRFTRDAISFAAGKPLELVDGARLKVLIEQGSRDEERGHLLDVASWSQAFAREATITTPACPFCRSEMVLRHGKQSGNRFWGCSTYPKCRGKRNVRPELMRA